MIKIVVSPEKEPVRLGLFGIPVNARNAARPTYKPAPINSLPAPKSEPNKIAPNIEVAAQTAPAVEKEPVKTAAKEIAVKNHVSDAGHGDQSGGCNNTLVDGTGSISRKVRFGQIESAFFLIFSSNSM